MTFAISTGSIPCFLGNNFPRCEVQRAGVGDKGFEISLLCPDLRTAELAAQTFRKCETGQQLIKACKETRITPGGAVCSGGYVLKCGPKD